MVFYITRARASPVTDSGIGIPHGRIDTALHIFSFFQVSIVVVFFFKQAYADSLSSYRC